MKYEDAVKKVQTKKSTDNYMIIETSYNTKILLPYKDGITFMSALVNAEEFKDSYGENPRILPVNKSIVSSTLLSREDYELIKIANLLNMSVDQLKDHAAQGVT